MTSSTYSTYSPLSVAAHIASEVIADMYLDYFNDYLTVETWARDNQMTLQQARDILTIGKAIHERECEKG